MYINIYDALGARWFNGQPICFFGNTLHYLHLTLIIIKLPCTCTLHYLHQRKKEVRSRKMASWGSSTDSSQGLGRLRGSSTDLSQSLGQKNLTLDFLLRNLLLRKSNVRFFAGELTFFAGGLPVSTGWERGRPRPQSCARDDRAPRCGRDDRAPRDEDDHAPRCKKCKEQVQGNLLKMSIRCK